MLIKEFLEKVEIKMYSKQVIRNMVLEIEKIDHEVSFNGIEDEKESKRDTNLADDKKIRKTEMREDESPIKDQKIGQKSKVDNSNSKITQYS
jgi:hypothetical protein